MPFDRHHCLYLEKSPGGAFLDVTLTPNARPAILCHCQMNTKAEQANPAHAIPAIQATTAAEFRAVWNTTNTTTK